MLSIQLYQEGYANNKFMQTHLPDLAAAAASRQHCKCRRQYLSKLMQEVSVMFGGNHALTLNTVMLNSNLELYF